MVRHSIQVKSYVTRATREPTEYSCGCPINGMPCEMLTGLCEPIQCPQVDIEVNGVVAGANCFGGDAVFRPTCEFLCEDGYEIVGASRTECGLSGAWPEAPSCQPISCPPLRMVASGEMPGATCLDGGDAAAATTCDLSCAPGFNLPPGQGQIICQNDGTSQPPFCTPSPCLPTSVQTRIMRYRPVLGVTGDRVFVQCNEGFTARVWAYMVPMVPKFSADNGLFARWNVSDRLVIKSGFKGAASKA